MQEEIESIALAVREHWELALSPISNLQLTLEENGIVITGFDTVDRKIDAFSQQTLIDDDNVFFIAVAQGENQRAEFSLIWHMNLGTFSFTLGARAST